jgi:hypothetical protein
MAAFLDGCRFNPTAGGTTDWTYSSVVPGYQSPAAANVISGALYKYRAESADLSQWELGEGAYSTGTGVLARTTVLFNSSGGTSKINFSTVPQVAVVALAEDLPGLAINNSFSGTQNVTNTTDASSSSAGGAFTIAGGLAIAKKLYVGTLAFFAGAVAIADATASTSTATGSLTTAGGIGAAGNMNIGGNLQTSGTATFGGLLTVTVSGTNTFGAGGTTNGQVSGVTLNGSSGTNSGAHFSFQRNGTNLFGIGNYSSLLGGGASPAGDDFVFYSYVSGAGVTAAIGISSSTGSVTVGSNFGTNTPKTITASTYTLTTNDSSLIFNGSGTITVTLQAASSYPGRWLYIKNIAAQTVLSASANVVPVISATAGTTLLGNSAGKWALMQSDGTNWNIMAQN